MALYLIQTPLLSINYFAIVLLIFVIYFLYKTGQHNTYEKFLSAILGKRAILVVGKDKRILSYSREFRKVFPHIIRGQDFQSFLNKTPELQDYQIDKEFVFVVHKERFLAKTVIVEDQTVFEIINLSNIIAAGPEEIRQTFLDFDSAPLPLIIDMCGNIISTSVRLGKYRWLFEEALITHISQMGIPQNNVERLIYEVENGLYESGTIYVKLDCHAVFSVHANLINSEMIAIELNLVGEKHRLEQGHIETLQTILESMDDGLMILDVNGQIIYGNERMLKILGITEVRGLNIQNIISLHDEKENPIRIDFPLYAQTYPYAWLTSAYSDQRYIVEYTVDKVYESNHYHVGYILNFRDISLRTQRQKEMYQFAYMDSLTGLYNRRYYSESLEYFKAQDIDRFSIFIVDCNNLKVINDAFGHEYGDQVIEATASVLQSCVPKDAKVFRIGGDEFAIIILNQELENIEEIKKNMTLKSELIRINQIELSLAIGFSYHKAGPVNIESMLLEAEKNMYHDKVLANRNASQTLLSTILKMLYDSNPQEKIYSDFVKEKSQLIATDMELDTEFIHYVGQAGKYHRIGLIIDEDQHYKHAFRILSALPEYSYLASSILYVSENFDGTGKPDGMVGMEIPLTSRIIKVTSDYFDLIHLQNIPIAKAQQYLIKNQEGLYDPIIVDILLSILK